MDSLATVLDLFNRGRAAEAEAACERILARTPDRSDVLTLLAELRSSSGRIEAAIDALRALAVLQPRDAANLRRLGSALLSLGKLAEAIEVQRRAVAIEPANIRGHNNLGQALMQLGSLPEAVQCFERTLEIDPGYAIGRMNLATALERLDHPELALLHYDRLSTLSPANADAWARRGAFLARLNRAAPALECFEQALRLRPFDADTLNQRAAALLSLERPAGALAAADQALAHHESTAALHVKAAALCRLRRPAEALPCIERALELAPENVEAWCHGATVHQRLEDRAGAARCYRRALDLDSSCVAARIGLIAGLIPAVPMSMAESLAARAEFDRELAAFEQWLEGRELGADDAWTVARQQFFYLSYDEESNKTLLERYRGAGAARLEKQTGLRATPVVYVAAQRRFRLGIVSAHVHDHSVYNALVRGWLQRIDRERFEITVFSLGMKRDAATEMAEHSVDCFEAGQRTLRDWAEHIRSREMDALIFPEVGIDRNSLALASLRLARRQLAAWGHPETSGLPTIDAFLSADAFEPAEGDQHYSEQLVRLPNLGVYYTPEPLDPVAVDLPALGITNQAPVFVCPGTPFKYRPCDDDVLVQIALRLRRCTFLFFDYERRELNALLRERLSAAFAAAGLPAERLLVWIPWQPRAAFLGILQQADVYLDTIGFSGFNTLMQAVEARLPCVAHDGRFMRGRLGSGILRRLGLEELIATSRTHFVDIAVRLATDRAYRADVSARLRLNAHRAYADASAVEALERLLIHEALETARKREPGCESRAGHSVGD
jgi:predicted O-linked N-acetylglucosamine transferase (SPINDLY family)